MIKITLIEAVCASLLKSPTSKFFALVVPVEASLISEVIPDSLVSWQVFGNRRWHGNEFLMNLYCFEKIIVH